MAPVQTTDLNRLKTGTAVLTTCVVQTLSESDPTFQERFLKKLTEAYYEAKDNSQIDPTLQLELYSYVRELLTGFNHVTGQGDPFLSK